MISIAVYTRSFLKELEESTGGKQRPVPAERPEPTPSRSRLGVLARAAGVAGTVAILATFLSLAAR